MILTFITPTTRHPIGGVAMILEFASALARRGHDVHVFHTSFGDRPIDDVDDITWFTFPESVQHHFPGSEPAHPASIPTADVIFGSALEDVMPEHAGLPAVFIQGFRMLSDAVERATFFAPGPKLCVASWLVEVGRSMGVNDHELFHVPLGLHHDRYPVITPLRERPPLVSFCYNAHPQKGAPFAVEALRRARLAVPGLRAVAFGNTGTAAALPEWLEFRHDPSHREIVEDIYNRSRVFLCTSEVEGFGLPSVEAMACGATLCTTDNGGSRDYAFPNETALVSPPGDLETFVDHLVSLLKDDDRRVELAERGIATVRRFDWEASASVLERVLEEYLRDPVACGADLARFTGTP